MFLTTFVNVLITLLYVVPGFVLCKCRMAKPEHLPTLSAILVYAGGPCLVLSTFIDMKYEKETFLKMLLFFLATFLVQLAFILIVYAVCRFVLRRDLNEVKYRILILGSVFGNVGFFGMPIVKGMFPGNTLAACYCSMCMVSMNILIFTIGMLFITGEKKYISLKSVILNPAVVSLAIALPIYFTGTAKYIPKVIVDVLNLFGNMCTPLCMIVLGIRLASVSMVKIFTRPMNYVTVFMKLIVFPLFCYAALRFLPLSREFVLTAVVLAATPCASNILNFSEFHHKDPELASNCILLSVMICFLTIPLFTLLP